MKQIHVFQKKSYSRTAVSLFISFPKTIICLYLICLANATFASRSNFHCLFYYLHRLYLLGTFYASSSLLFYCHLDISYYQFAPQHVIMLISPTSCKLLEAGVASTCCISLRSPSTHPRIVSCIQCLLKNYWLICFSLWGRSRWGLFHVKAGCLIKVTSHSRKKLRPGMSKRNQDLRVWINMVPNR